MKIHKKADNVKKETEDEGFKVTYKKKAATKDHLVIA